MYHDNVRSLDHVGLLGRPAHRLHLEYGLLQVHHQLVLVLLRLQTEGGHHLLATLPHKLHPVLVGPRLEEADLHTQQRNVLFIDVEASLPSRLDDDEDVVEEPDDPRVTLHL